MEKCEFSFYNGEEQYCSVTKEKCIYDWLFPDAVECHETTRIYPEYSYINRMLEEAYNGWLFGGFGKGSTNINGYHISRSKDGYTINHGKEIYSKNDLIKKLIKSKKK